MLKSDHMPDLGNYETELHQNWHNCSGCQGKLVDEARSRDQATPTSGHVTKIKSGIGQISGVTRPNCTKLGTWQRRSGPQGKLADKAWSRDGKWAWLNHVVKTKKVTSRISGSAKANCTKFGTSIEDPKAN